MQRERIEWCDIWVEEAEAATLPRALFVGDSITRSYYPHVSKQLAPTYACARIASSKCVGDPLLLKELELVLGEYEFAFIHFNNGLHGWGYEEDAYADGLARTMDFITGRSSAGSLIWASSTPVWTKNGDAVLDPKTERIRERNRRAAILAAERGISVNDLFSAVIGHPEYFSPDGVHFVEEGRMALGDKVVAAIRRLDPCSA